MMNVKLNGWQRLWVVASCIYIFFLGGVTAYYGLPGTHESVLVNCLLLTGVAIIPIVGVYFIGISCAWISQGFRQFGYKQVPPWNRLWVVGSIALLIGTGGRCFEKIRHAIIANHILNGTLAPGEEAAYYVQTDDNGRREVYVQLARKGVWDWVSLGRVVVPSSQEILEKTGEYNEITKQWNISKEIAVSLLAKHRSGNTVFAIAGALGSLLFPPFIFYGLIYCLVLSITWIAAGFRHKGKPVST